MNTSPTRGPIPYRNLLLFPIAIVAGIVGGAFLGAIFLPYVVLIEIARKIGQHWSYLDGWAEWAESSRRPPQARRGWLAVWVVWTLLYFMSMFSWGPWAGAILGPFLCCWLVLVPNGFPRLMAMAAEARNRFRRVRIIPEDRRETA